MATKHELITELYTRTQKNVTAPQEWQRFLSTACRNFRLSFDEQLLLYAQRPDATAVLEIDKWNRQFGRWVNRGATGIAVFDGDTTGRARLKYYFDVSDTHPGRFSRRVPIWTMRREYEQEATEALENSCDFINIFFWSNTLFGGFLLNFESVLVSACQKHNVIALHSSVTGD